eukprot:comp8754_c0_seq1/m.3985 comp8754_c0_seq1/g.3985  ORF comp8754_c0_seq1/g.3985 comp8754_c0_seq1/m.3985 type:complete len:304 (-) comp8754_c0_seq1:965-1876(-)
MVSTEQTINTQHDDMIHDAQLDYYGKRLATASSDRTVKVFDVGADGQYTRIADLRGHDGAVWQVSWAHPKFGNILASCSYDKRVIIWKETNGQWGRLFEYARHESSVNAVAWAPHEYGLVLAAVSSDGRLSILAHIADDQTAPFKEMAFEVAHPDGCNAVSWAPAIEEMAKGRRLVTGGCDNSVLVWRMKDGRPERVCELQRHNAPHAHDDWVRDVAWAPNVGLPSSLIATCSQDMTVRIWSQRGDSEEWDSAPVELKFSDVVWRVSWSITGNILAVSSGDKVTLWKEQQEGSWEMVQHLDQQ